MKFHRRVLSLFFSCTTAGVLLAASNTGFATLEKEWSQISTSGFSDPKEAQRVMQAYHQSEAAFAHADTDTKKMRATFNSFLQQTKENLSNTIDNDLQSKMMMAKRWEMVADQALQSGTNVPQNMIDLYKQMANVDALKNSAGIYSAIAGSEDAQAQNFSEKVAYIEQVGVKMGAIDTAVTPRDSYKDADKAELAKKIEQEWKSLYPNDAIIGIRFIDAAWSKRSEERYNDVSGWYDLDISSLEVKVVIKQDTTIAEICPVFLLKDHLNGDTLEIDVSTAKSTAGMCSRMLVANYKP